MQGAQSMHFRTTTAIRESNAAYLTGHAHNYSCVSRSSICAWLWPCLVLRCLLLLPFQEIDSNYAERLLATWQTVNQSHQQQQQQQSACHVVPSPHLHMPQSHCGSHISAPAAMWISSGARPSPPPAGGLFISAPPPPSSPVAGQTVHVFQPPPPPPPPPQIAVYRGVPQAAPPRMTAPPPAPQHRWDPLCFAFHLQTVHCSCSTVFCVRFQKDFIAMFSGKLRAPRRF